MKYLARPVFFLQLIFTVMAVVVGAYTLSSGGPSYGEVALALVFIAPFFYPSLLLSVAGLILGLVGIMKHKEENEYKGMVILAVIYFLLLVTLDFWP